VVRHLQEEFEFMLAELLPFAPTNQRSSKVWTAYNPLNRHYSVAVQDYPAVGLDTFFVVQINNDVTSATSLVSNVILGHPDGAPGNPGSMSLSRVMYDQNGDLLTLFADGRLYRLDILGSRAYKLLADIIPDDNSSVKVSNAHVRDGLTLKSITYESSSDIAYLVKTDLTSYNVSAPVEIKKLKGMVGTETPLVAHMMRDPNTDTTFLGVMYHGNFDQILRVDEVTGEQTSVIGDLYHDSTNANQLVCYEGAKDCDFWATSAYDEKNGVLYFQSHSVADDLFVGYIFNMPFLENRVTGIYYPVVSESVTMTFGYAGYQWVSFV
jgi:hypothetical protein